MKFWHAVLAVNLLLGGSEAYAQAPDEASSGSPTSKESTANEGELDKDNVEASDGSQTGQDRSVDNRSAEQSPKAQQRTDGSAMSPAASPSSLPEPSAAVVDPEDTHGGKIPVGGDEPEQSSEDSTTKIDSKEEPELDKTGSPEPPPKDGEDAPEGKWKKDYNGRDDPGRAEDGLIWIPRAPLYPVHLVLNYGVRWPLVAGITKAEEVKLFARIEDFFTFADGKAGLYPTAFYDAGRGFWGGANFYYNDLGTEGHTLRATAGVGTNNWILAVVKDSWKLFDGDRGALNFHAMFHRNPTYAFTGLGPDTDIDDQVFFAEEKFEFATSLEVALEDLNRFKVEFNFRRAIMGDGRSPSIDDADFDIPESGLTGFDERFFLGSFAMTLDLDSRSPKDDWIAGSGVRLESFGSYHLGPGSTRLSFFRYGVRPSLLWDITGANHVLALSVYTEALSRTGGEEVPLNELVTLGGTEEMKGFFPGRFRGQSALVHSLDYTWPLLAFADAMLFTELGTAFNGFFEDFAYKKMVLDWGVGMKTTVMPELSLWGALAFGTNQLEHWNDDFNVDSIRFVMGVTRGF